MESPQMTQTKSNERGPVSALPNSKFGMIGCVLGVLGFFISCGTLLIIYIIMVAGGGLDIMLTPAQERAIIIVLCFGLFLGIAGGILGAVSLTRGENKVAGIISIVFGVLMFCICSVLALIMMTLNLMLG